MEYTLPATALALVKRLASKNCDIEIGQEFLPAALSSAEVGLRHEVLESVMIGVHHELRAEQVAPPLF